MNIRFAEQSHISGMIDLLRQVGQVHHLGRPDLFRKGAQKYAEADLLALLKDPSRPIFVAVEEDKVLGYGFCILKETKNDPVLQDYKTLYIDDLCVDERCRGQRVGSRLYRHICGFAKEQGCRSVTLNVWSCNESAMEFYRRMGLVPQKVGMEFLLEER